MTGFGELLGYGLRLVSGRAADKTGLFWPITIAGYVIHIASVPALTLTGSWPTAAVLIILGGFWTALVGAAVWGLGMGVHESIIPAAVALMVSINRRVSAFGLFTAGYGVAWFVGSAAIGILYDWSVSATITFCAVAELAALPCFVWVTVGMTMSRRPWADRSAHCFTGVINGGGSLRRPAP